MQKCVRVSRHKNHGRPVQIMKWMSGLSTTISYASCASLTCSWKPCFDGGSDPNRAFPACRVCNARRSDAIFVRFAGSNAQCSRCRPIKIWIHAWHLWDQEELFKRLGLRSCEVLEWNPESILEDPRVEIECTGQRSSSVKGTGYTRHQANKDGRKCNQYS